MTFDWNWRFAVDSLPLLLAALRVTLLATILGSVLALLVGLPLALARRSRWRLLAWPALAWIEFIRGTPLLIQLYCLFYVLPGFGLRLDPLTTGVLALGLHYGTYTAEAYRAGIEAVPAAQREAALALGFTRWHTLRRIILPQALPPIVPVLGNYTIAMFKDTPLLSTITVLELLHAAKDLGAGTFRYLEPFTLVGVLFLTVSLGASAVVRLFEHRLRPGMR